MSAVALVAALAFVSVFACLSAPEAAFADDTRATYRADGVFYADDTGAPVANRADIVSLTVAPGVSALPDDFLNYNGSPAPALSSLSLPASLTSIGNFAFFNCANLSSISGGEAVSGIGDSCFCSTGITTFDSFSALTSMGDGAFAGCTSLSHITLTDGLRQIPKNCFYNTPQLTSVTVPASVSSIRGGAFRGSGLTDLYLSSSVYVPGIIHAPEPTGASGVPYGVFRGAPLATVHASCDASDDGMEALRAAVVASEAPAAVAVDRPDHVWDGGAVTVAPGCTDDGVFTYTCTVCGSTRSQPIAALGHDWGPWITVRDATADADGLQQRTCNRCGEVEERGIPATGQVPVGESSVPSAAPLPGRLSAVAATRAATPTSAIQPRTQDEPETPTSPGRAVFGSDGIGAAGSPDFGVERHVPTFREWMTFGPLTLFQKVVVGIGSLLLLLLIVSLAVNLRDIIWYRRRCREHDEARIEAGESVSLVDSAARVRMVRTVALVVGADIVIAAAALLLAWNRLPFMDVLCVGASAILLGNCALLRGYANRLNAVYEGARGLVDITDLRAGALDMKC